jgi:hypothetical protein
VIPPFAAFKCQRYGGQKAMRKLIISIHSTANDIVTGPPSDKTNFMVWAQAGIEDSLEAFLKSLANVDTILLGRATYEDLVRKWPKVKEWPYVSDVIEKRSTLPQNLS